MDACGGESNSQHILFCGDVVGGGDAVQVIHVAEIEGKKRERKFNYGAKKSVSDLC